MISSTTVTVYRFGDCELDTACHELRRDGSKVPIEPQVHELLVYLIRHRDRVVTRAELFDTLWKGRIVTESALNSSIKALRSAIGDDGKSQSRIRTLHRTGYRFVGQLDELAAVPAPTANDAAPEPSAEARPAAAPVGRPRAGLVGMAFAVLLAAGAFWMLARDAAGPAAVASAPASLTVAAEAGTKSIAVLPFANLSPDVDQEYFADGISEELLNVLSRIPDLRVTGRVSSFRFKGRSESLHTIGATLGVQHLLTGSVRKAGDRVRVTAQLVDATSGYQLWSDSYDRPVRDIFDVQDEISGRVATALQVTLGLGESGEPGMTRNVAAFDEFLRATSLYREYRPESFVRAIEHLQRAVALDPAFSRAWAYMHCIHLDGAALGPDRTGEWLRRAAEALEQARALTPDAPVVQILNASTDARRGDRLKARAALDTLPVGRWTADPYLNKDMFEGRFLISTGHAKAAIEPLERARAVDPLSPVVALYLSMAYATAGDSAGALAEIDRGLALGGLEPVLLGNALLVALGTRDRQEIEKRLAATSASSNPAPDLHLGLTQLFNEPAASHTRLRRLAGTPSSRDFPRGVLVTHWAAYHGDDELALEHLSAVAHGSIDEALLWRPALGDMRRLPGFKDLVRREGYVDYWRARGWPDFCRPTVGDDFECG